ncbi:MAG: ATP-binding cassette domain-containing protein, partial [Pseudomonadota bacterium]
MKRRLLIPEVIQTSGMDCGPAALKAIFGGFGRYLSYGRLREACQTDVDGTSIDALEELAPRLGLTATQSMLPADFVLREEFRALPAIAVIRLADGAPHFVVLWRVHGAFVQVMDPGEGRVWMHRDRLLESLYVHEQDVPRAAWEEWSDSAEFRATLAARMRALGVTAALWPDLAQQDAALRLAGTLRQAKQLPRGEAAAQLLALCAEHPAEIPAEFWAARAVATDAGQLRLRGAVVLSISGAFADAADAPLPDTLTAVLNEPPPRVWIPVIDALHGTGWLLPAALAAALFASALGAVLDVLLLRALIDLRGHLELGLQRFGAMAALLVFLGALLAVEWLLRRGLQDMGTLVEGRLRARLLQRIPRLDDRYFQSRLVSDMAMRAHWLQLLHELPSVVAQLARLCAGIVITALAIIWLFSGAAPWTLLAAAVACALPFLFVPALTERDLQVRDASAALSRFYLDALLGVRAVQAHAAEQVLRDAQAPQLRQWLAAGLRQQSLVIRAETIQLVVAIGAVITLVWRQMATVQQPASLLLLVYWALSLVLLGQQAARLFWSLPALRNTLLRLMELLNAPATEPATAAVAARSGGVKVELEAVDVVVAGRCVLENISLHVQPGEHVAVVGPSGAGKSSLVGLLLGWYTTACGRFRVDGAVLDAAALSQLRRETVWIDPQVHLFQGTLFDNLVYGNGAEAATHVADALRDAALVGLMGKSPQGLQSQLGENGALVSGGEGQRVRIGRGFGRQQARLVVLDEPARGLDRDARAQFLATARQRFAGATLFYVTHDIAHTRGFDRVLVVEDGHIREQGAPAMLCQQQGSRYRQLLDQEGTAHRQLWSNAVWRHLRLREGRLVEARAGAESQQLRA